MLGELLLFCERKREREEDFLDVEELMPRTEEGHDQHLLRKRHRRWNIISGTVSAGRFSAGRWIRITWFALGLHMLMCVCVCGAQWCVRHTTTESACMTTRKYTVRSNLYYTTYCMSLLYTTQHTVWVYCIIHCILHNILYECTLYYTPYCMGLLHNTLYTIQHTVWVYCIIHCILHNILHGFTA